MSPPRKPTGNPPGRPRKVAADAAADVVEEGRSAVVDMAVKAKVHPATIKRRLQERRARKGTPAKPGGARGETPATASTRPAEPPQTGPGPLDRLRSYAAHDPPALAALDALLVGDEGGLGRDELADLREGLRLAADVVRKAAQDRDEDGDGPLLRALQRLEGLGKTVATVKAKRPQQDGPDEATRRILAVRERAVARAGVLTGEEAEAFAQRRVEFGGWADQSLGPVLGAEVRRRVGVMLGEAAG